MITLSHQSSATLRWILILPVALLGAVLAQYAGIMLTVRPMHWIVHDPDAAWWLAKSLTSLFMGGAFVASAVLVAPTYKRSVALVGLGVVLVWAGFLAFGGPPVFGVLMGGMGVVGAAGSYFFAFRGKESRG